MWILLVLNFAIAGYTSEGDCIKEAGKISRNHKSWNPVCVFAPNTAIVVGGGSR